MCIYKFVVKFKVSTSFLLRILADYNAVEVQLIPCVAVKYVDIRRNIGSVSALLGRN